MQTLFSSRCVLCLRLTFFTAFGLTLTYQCLDGVKYAFPNATKKLEESGKYNDVFKLYEAVKERPKIKEYLESDRRQKYSLGIYRHYPELDEQ